MGDHPEPAADQTRQLPDSPGFVTQSKARQDATTRTTGQLLFGVGDQTCVYDGQRIDVKSEADAVQVNAGTRRNFS